MTRAFRSERHWCHSTPDAVTLLAAKGIGKTFGALAAIERIDFAVAADEAVGIVGPNGAGKTTLLNVLAGAYAPSSGSVFFRGANVTAAGAAERCRLGIARSHQVPRPFGGMTWPRAARLRLRHSS